MWVGILRQSFARLVPFFLFVLVSVSSLMLKGFEFGLLTPIALLCHPAGKFLLELRFDRCVLWIIGDIFPFQRVGFHVVQFFGRSMVVTTNFVGGVCITGFGLRDPGFEHLGLGGRVREFHFGRKV